MKRIETEKSQYVITLAMITRVQGALEPREVTYKKIVTDYTPSDQDLQEYLKAMQLLIGNEYEKRCVTGYKVYVSLTTEYYVQADIYDEPVEYQGNAEEFY